MANECKKFSLFACCLMTMQALRLVISTAGFCVVRFHIDCELFNIFISRLVNAVLMSQLFGNWLGDLIVFAASGPLKLYATALANWVEFLCFCSALICICSGEQGKLTGFYWSMVIAYFWWKVGEAPCTSIGGSQVDWYFAGFTLSGVWAAMLKAVVMMCVQQEKGIRSDVLGDVNVTVVGTVNVVGERSVKTTVDYRAAKWLFSVTIAVTALMCLVWEGAQTTMHVDMPWVWGGLRKAVNRTEDQVDKSNNKLAKAIQALETVQVKPKSSGNTNRTVNNATVDPATGVVKTGANQITIVVKGVSGDGTGPVKTGKDGTDKIQTALQSVDKSLKDKISSVEGTVAQDGNTMTITVTTSAADRDTVLKQLNAAANWLPVSNSNNMLAKAIKKLGSVATSSGPSGSGTAQLSNATVEPESGVEKGTAKDQITITVTGVSDAKEGAVDFAGNEKIKGALLKLVGAGSMDVTGTVKTSDTLIIIVTVNDAGWLVDEAKDAVMMRTAIATAAIFAVPGALIFSWLGKLCRAKRLIVWVITGGVVAGVVVSMAFMMVVGQTGKGPGEEWVPMFKWNSDWRKTVTWAAMIGLVAGTAVGAWVGRMIGLCTGSKKRGTAAGAFIGGFVGIISGEIVNGCKTWRGENFTGGNNKPQVLGCGFCIVVMGLGTVYSIYPGMAPCSITQFKYFNIIDIWILILSAIAPIVIMLVDLAEADWRLAMVILGKEDDPVMQGSTVKKRELMWGAVGSALVMLVGTNICEVIVICVLQYPHSNLAQRVTTSGWRACLLTIMMVTFQLTSTGIGFACVGAGSGLNVGWMNVNSTAVLWTTECCGVLGEGYLTELKKYEPGKWPTQGMGKWASYRWWNKKAFGNAWAIWCCIGTTDLRRDIMLCRQ